MSTPESALDQQFTSALSLIQRSFSFEVAETLTRAITDAKTRRHPNVTPLHVAAVLLSSPQSLLHHACTRIMLQPEQFLHCGSLNLCFKDALDKISTPVSSLLSIPCFSDTLKVCLKSAQTTQMPGSPGYTLHVTQIDLSLLTVSILDDPLVSSVMSEVGIPPSRIKQSIITYMNSRKIRGQEIVRAVSDYRQQIKKVKETLMRQQMRNPVLVGDHSGMEFIMEDVRGMMRRGEFGDLNVISVGDSLSQTKVSELCDEIRRIMHITSHELLHGKGVILDLGDLKWLVDDEQKRISQPNAAKQTMEENRQNLIEAARIAILEVGAIVKREHRIWILANADYATYLKCQIYHPNMEKDWEIQVIQFSPLCLVGVSPSFSGIEDLGSYVETSDGFAFCSLNHVMQHSRDLENVSLCSTCLKQHDDEMLSIQLTYQLGLYNNRQSEEYVNNLMGKLCKKWHATCRRLHYQLEIVPSLSHSNNSTNCTLPTNWENVPSRLMPSSAANFHHGASGNDDFQIRVTRGLMWVVSWQPEAVISVVSAVMDVKLGSRNTCRNKKLDTWLLFNGFDYLGKIKMADALSTLAFGTEYAYLNFSMRRNNSIGEHFVQPSGRALLDLLVGVVKANRSQVIILDGIDQADVEVRTTIRHSIMTGLLINSNFQVVGGLGSNIFVLIVGGRQAKKEVTCHLKLSTKPETGNHGIVESELGDPTRKTSKMVSRSLSLDLSLCVGSISDIENDEDDNGDNDVIVRDGENIGQLNMPVAVTASIGDIYHFVDRVVDFKPVDLNHVKHAILQTLSNKFGAVMGATLSLRVKMDVLDFLADHFWYSYGGTPVFEQWADVTFVPAVEQMRRRARVKDGDMIYLSLVEGRDPSMMTSNLGPTCRYM